MLGEAGLGDGRAFERPPHDRERGSEHDRPDDTRALVATLQPVEHVDRLARPAREQADTGVVGLELLAQLGRR